MRELRDSRRRRPSNHAAAALKAFGEIRHYFPHDTTVAEALDWDIATVAAWRAGDVVRPQKAKVVQVLLLHELCEEARAYFDDDADVARWITAPLPNLVLPARRGATPAMWLNAYKKAGLDELTRGLVEWMPKIPESDLEPVSDGAATSHSDDPAVREFERMLAELS
ncbi:MAG: hypothetical protein WKF41_04185 [Gaiellaceae bacterium]